MIKGECNANGVIHAVIGAAGYAFSPVNETAPDWVRFATDHQYGYARISITGAATATSTLTFAFAESATGNEIDSFKIVKKQDISFDEFEVPTVKDKITQTRHRLIQ